MPGTVHPLKKTARRLSFVFPCLPYTANMEEYLRHLASISALLEWRARWKALLTAPGADPMIRLSELGFDLSSAASRRFILGSPKSPQFGAGVFLGIQEDELKWFMGMSFARSHVAPNRSRLYLITSKMVCPGASDRFPVIPAFYLSWPLPDPRMAGALGEFSVLEGRGFQLPESSGSRQLTVSSGRPLFSVPLTSYDIPENQDVLNGDEMDVGISLDERLSGKFPALAGTWELPVNDETHFKDSGIKW